MATKVRLTAEDLLRMPDDDVRRELVNGEIVEMSPANFRHGELTIRLGRLLSEHVEERGGGKVVSDVGFVLNLSEDAERVRGPDVAFVSSTRLPENPEKFVNGAPDLAVEILSPSETAVEVQQKLRDYLEAGTRLVWFVAPQAKTVTVYRSDGGARLLREHERLEGEDVLPGLTIPLAELFK